MSESWNDFLLTGVDWIDTQHKELVARFDTLSNAIRAEHGDEELRKTLEFLDQYVIEHFKTEEDYMEEHNYPKKKVHSEKHEEFRRLVTDFEEKLKEHGATTEVELKLKKELLDWIINHIGSHDKELAYYK